MRRKLLDNTKDDPNRWVVSYADFTTMLLALFVVLYAVSQLDIAKMRDFTSSLKRSFTTVEKDTKKKKKQIGDIFATTKVKISIRPIEVTFQDQIDSLKEKLAKAEEKVSTDMVQLDNVKGLLEKEFDTQKEINMVHSERGLTISLADTILFDTGSADLKAQADPTLEKIAEIIKDIPNSIRVEGHTDDKPIKTSQYPSNWELSTARATSLLKKFVDKYNVSPTKISAAGFGEYRPIDTNTTPEGRQKNRRVDIVILSVGSQIFEPPAQ